MKLTPLLLASLATSTPFATTGTITAIGLGVNSLTASQSFYTGLGYGKGSRMSFGGWDEIIMTPKTGTQGPAIIPMKFKPDRPTRDLPVKLTFASPDPAALLAKIVAAGGKAASGPEGALWAKDIDGYLLELVHGTTGLVAAGYGSGNVSASAAFFAALAGTTPGSVTKRGTWDVAAVPTRKKMRLEFVAHHDGRPTAKLPLKIVWGVSSIPGFKSTITGAGGTLVTKGLGALGGMVGLAWDPVEQIMIEINSGGD
ncbi:hypothetical protein EJ06DRAFT_305372 [Trichodelitschia bisporula]|uniref:Glyoxalase-like domain-containing protein n=1 Tax=Trichodelitschia bisporula TaxID=703511 RepID=A0A6G1I2X9_9PEZI|nr:hypothetical protein EJ06DRAFT_305372 [Trichodelitschia bisporula]